jgi:hypothetical protein
MLQLVDGDWTHSAPCFQTQAPGPCLQQQLDRGIIPAVRWQATL